MVQPGKPLVTTWFMRIACWISKAIRINARTCRRARTHARINTRAHTLRICNNYCFSTAKIVAQTPLSVTFIRKLRVFVIIANACLPLLTVPALFIFSFSLIHPLLLVYIALAVPYITLY
jgi:hypothetical protein